MLSYKELISDENTILIIEYGNLKSNRRDIDLIIVNNLFGNMIMTKRKKYCESLLKSDLPLDILCFTRQEFLDLIKCNNKLVDSFMKGRILI